MTGYNGPRRLKMRSKAALPLSWCQMIPAAKDAAYPICQVGTFPSFTARFSLPPLLASISWPTPFLSWALSLLSPSLFAPVLVTDLTRALPEHSYQVTHDHAAGGLLLRWRV